MSVQIEQLDGLKRCINIVIDADRVKVAYDKHLAKVLPKVKVDGFRPGKVPAQVVEQRYGEGILQETMGELIDSSFRSAINDEGLLVAGQPDFDFKAIEKNKPFEYSATFEVYPDIQLKDLEGAAIDQYKVEINAQDEEKMITHIQKQHATWEEVDRASENGDQIIIDFDGYLDGKAFEGGASQNFNLELGAKQMIPGFEDAIVGMSAGEERDITVDFPKEYPVADLAGREALFKIKAHKVQQSQLPEMNDELAKKLGFEDGLDKFKDSMREKMQAEAERASKDRLKNDVMDKLLELNEFLVPQALVETEIKHLQDMAKQQMAMQQGLKEPVEMDLPREPYVEAAEKRVALGLLLSEIVKQKEIVLDKDRLNDHVKEMLGDHPNADQLIDMYIQNEQLRAQIEVQILEQQAVEKLLEDANITEKTESYDAFMNSK